MSQYVVKVPAKGRVYRYGFDRPLQEYFLSVTTRRGNSFSLVGSMSETYGSGVNLAEAVKQFKLDVPKEHVAAMQMDMPF